MMSWFLTILFIGIINAVEQQSFRSILIERACVKRPELDFCGPTTPGPIASSIVPLVLPPTTTTTESTTTTSTASTTTSTTSASTTTSSKSSTESVDFEEDSDLGNSTSTEHEKLGSLVKLPKPEKSNTEKVVDQVIEHSGIASPSDSKNSTVPEVQIEDEKGVLVFVSEYCVVERERFVRGCHGDIVKKEEDFCKTYVSACASTTGVLPVMTYCARYYTYYPTHCKSQLVDSKALQFCFAFEQFCLPEKTAAQSPEKPKSSLRKCEDVLPEARKVCNPFPNPKDTFNLLRCTHFLTNCKKFVDWL